MQSAVDSAGNQTWGRICPLWVLCEDSIRKNRLPAPPGDVFQRSRREQLRTTSPSPMVFRGCSRGVGAATASLPVMSPPIWASTASRALPRASCDPAGLVTRVVTVGTDSSDRVLVVLYAYREEDSRLISGRPAGAEVSPNPFPFRSAAVRKRRNPFRIVKPAPACLRGALCRRSPPYNRSEPPR